MFGKKKSLVGLDIGQHSVKVVELSGPRDSLSITGFGEAPLSSRDTRGETIRTLLKQTGIKGRRIAASVCGRSVIVRYVNMVSMSDEELKGAIRFEADKYIPFDIDEVVLDCQRLEDLPGQEGDQEQEMKVLLVAVKRGVIDEQVNLFNELGLIPAVIDIDSFAIGNAFEMKSLHSPRIEDEGQVVALVDIGASKTEINIMCGGTSYFSREVYVAGNNFTEAIANHIQLGVEEAEKIKVAPEGRQEEVEEAVAPVLEDLGNEIHLSFDYYENQYDRTVENIYLSGGSSQLPGLQQGFERVLNRSVNFWDPTENLEIGNDNVDIDSLKNSGSRLAVAVGLASRILD